MKPSKRSGGRPAKAASDRKEILLQVRLDQAERESFQQAANVGGVPLSAWVRERLRRAAIRELEEVGVRAPFLRDLYPRED